MLSVTERMLRIATANPAVLARVDAVLCGDIATPKPETDVRLCTYTETAKMMKLSRPTIYRMVQAGRLKTIALNGTNRILYSSVVDCVSGKGAK